MIKEQNGMIVQPTQPHTSTLYTTAHGTAVSVDVMASMFDQEDEPSIQPAGSKNLAHTLYPVSSTSRKVRGGYCTRRFLVPTAGGEANLQEQKKGPMLWEIKMFHPEDIIGVPFRDRWEKYQLKATYVGAEGDGVTTTLMSVVRQIDQLLKDAKMPRREISDESRKAF